ncbi:MAG: hypothetical protein AAGC68_10735, partial [Verrucomicrobiota bacterium]
VHRLVKATNRHLNYFARGNLLGVLRAAAMGSQMRLVERSIRQAEVYLPAMSPRSGWHDYHRHADYIEIGRLAAEEALPQIEALFTESPAAGPDISTIRKRKERNTA